MKGQNKKTAKSRKTDGGKKKKRDVAWDRKTEKKKKGKIGD